MSVGNHQRTLKLAVWLLAVPSAVSYFLPAARPAETDTFRGYQAFWISLVSFPSVFTAEAVSDRTVAPIGLAWVANLLVAGLLVCTLFSAPPKWLRRVLTVLALVSPLAAWWPCVYLARDLLAGYYVWAGSITLFSALAFVVLKRRPGAGMAQSDPA